MNELRDNIVDGASVGGGWRGEGGLDPFYIPPENRPEVQFELSVILSDSWSRWLCFGASLLI